MSLTRRNTLMGAGALAAYAAGLPGLAEAQGGGQVVVGTWGGDYGELLRQMIDQPLMKPQNVEVLQDLANADPRKTKLIAERQSRRGSMDVACLSDSDMYLIAQQGVFDEVPLDRVKGAGAIIPALRKSYAIPHIYSYRVILYNPNKVTAPPKSYADLFDPKWRGRVGLSDILYRANTESAALAGGGSVSNYEPAQKKLMEWRSLDVKLYPSNEALDAALQAEEVWLTVMWMARGFMWQKAGIPLKHVVPAEGATTIVFEAAVPKNSRNKDNAWRYLDAMLDPKAQAGFADRMGYVPTVTTATLPPELAQQLSLTDAERARLLTPDFAYVTRSQSQILEFWNKQFKG